MTPLEALRAHRWRRVANERRLHDEIEQALRVAKFDVMREVRLDAHHRVDLAVRWSPDRWEEAEGPLLAIEAKIGGSASELLRQVQGYAKIGSVSAIIAVTTRRRHAVLLPNVIGGKPLSVVYAGGWGA